MTNRLYSLREIAKLLDVSKTHVWQQWRAGIIKESGIVKTPAGDMPLFSLETIEALKLERDRSRKKSKGRKKKV